MIEESPKVPAEGASKSVRDKYDHLQAANNKEQYYMLTSMVDSLKKKMEYVETTYKIKDQLQDMFRAKSVHTCFEATKKYACAQMALSQHTHVNLIKMTNYFHKAKLHGAITDEETQVSFILKNLSLAFLAFTTNYVMSKLKYGLTHLMNEFPSQLWVDQVR
ncbi:uncharacterized protein LOC133792247 [Humulus lupulus]|uniref:uncharacterized protein LOC133792247 n=1 Tax=Humulus lupulus TaxID=3486 RepID=UPI002B414F93|nr:uncharacterized protein LOC133792247 [Humulus lupulus]